MCEYEFSPRFFGDRDQLWSLHSVIQSFLAHCGGAIRASRDTPRPRQLAARSSIESDALSSGCEHEFTPRIVGRQGALVELRSHIGKYLHDHADVRMALDQFIPHAFGAPDPDDLAILQPLSNSEVTQGPID